MKKVKKTRRGDKENRGEEREEKMGIKNEWRTKHKKRIKYIQYKEEKKEEKIR